MEKYRKFSDAATGVNPFLTQRVPSALGRFLSPIMFPCRLLFLFVFATLLLLVEAVLVYGLCYNLLGRLCGCMEAAEAVYTYSGLGLLREGLLLRGFFFFLGHVLPVKIDPMMYSTGAVPPSKRNSINGGDIVFCNSQSVWDFMVLEVILKKPFLAVAFPTPPAGFFASPPPSPSAETVQLFLPGALQRYHVWRHIHRSNTLPYVQALARWQRETLDSSSHADAAPHKPYVDVALAAQCRARQLRVPLVYFAEGTATNGRGVLQLPRLRCFSNEVEPATAEPVLRAHTATLFYQSDALLTVCAEHEGRPQP
ncbi:hypothetical protein STCU_06094, partial [Strigomonas culicis]